MSHDLEQYQRHLEKFGPEFLLQTAATELRDQELSELKAIIGSIERVFRWHKGACIERPEDEPRKCAQCLLDLPQAASKLQIYHPHCRDKARRLRRRQA